MLNLSLKAQRKCRRVLNLCAGLLLLLGLVLVHDAYTSFAVKPGRPTTKWQQPLLTVTAPLSANCPDALLKKFPRRAGFSERFSVDMSDVASGKYMETRGWLGQESEDRWLFEHFFHSMKNGTFVELGALDGLRFSNSYIFEKLFGWKGILIEGETLNYGALESNRGQDTTSVITLHAGVCEERGMLRLRGSGPMASQYASDKRISTAPCFRMDDMLNFSGLEHVDLLSLDVEGAELTVLQTLDFNRYPTSVTIVEMREVDEDSNPLIRKLLHSEGFCRFASDVGHSNEVWVNPGSARLGIAPESLSASLETDLIPAYQCESFLGLTSADWLSSIVPASTYLKNCTYSFGVRPTSHTPDLMGTTCEPWLARCAVEALDRILKPDMVGLEWSCGSSTLWYLERLSSLYSIEHDAHYYNTLQEYISNNVIPNLASRWKGQLVLPGTSVNLTTHPFSTEDYDKMYGEYVRHALTLPFQVFDFIVVDGRSRSACLKLIVDHVLLKQEGGILVLDNAERQHYAKAIKLVPHHWDRYDFSNQVDTTIVWISRHRE